MSSDNAARKDILASLITRKDLRLPARLDEKGCSPADKRQYLDNLLQNDPGVFLERHGQLLSAEQRGYFAPLRNTSYEIDFYLKLFEDEAKAKESSDQAASRSTTKNRRLAKMKRLAKEGFFDEEAARQRAPLLHHQYIGKYRDNLQRSRASTLHDQIIQQHEEHQIRVAMAEQQQQEDAAGQAFEATLSESESDSDEGMDGTPGITKMEKFGELHAEPVPSDEEMQQNVIDFRAIMEARFMDGEDGGADADHDASLDEDWVKERTQDLEDKYFESSE